MIILQPKAKLTRMFSKYYEKLKPTIDQFRKLVDEVIEWLTPQARKLKTEIEQVGDHIHPVTKSDEGIRRMAAFALDCFIAFLLFLFPLGGWILSLAYLLFRDALPFLNGQSAGKRFFQLRVVKKVSLRPITRNYKRSFKRSITLLVPIVNLVDIFMYFTRGGRAGDQWADTLVIDERYDTSSNKGSRT